MEKWLDTKMASNLKRTFWKPKTRVISVKKDLGFPDSANPGPTEWVVVSKALYEQLRDVALTPENCETVLAAIFAAHKPVVAEAGDLLLVRDRDGRRYEITAKANMLYY
jgi:hypothetical protein